MKKKVYITDHVFENLIPTHEVLDDVAEVIELHVESSAELKYVAVDADALMICYLPDIGEGVMDALPMLKGIVRTGIGFDTIDLAAAKAHGIQVANVPDYCIDEVSDHAVALLLALNRKIALSSNRIKGGCYGLDYVHPLKALRSNTVTILGYGRIGRRIAQKLEVFGCTLQFYDPFVSEDARAKKVELEEAYETSDVLVLQMPSTPKTRYMLNDTAFAKMRKCPYIVNAARGDLIDTDALERALISGQIAGAGLDVVDGASSYGADFQLCKYENVILTPHSAWVSENAMVELQRLSALECRRIVLGENVKNSVIR